MTEPDEVYAAWEACACDRYEDEENGNPLDLPQGMPNFADFRDGYRAGQAASAERIKALEEELAVALMQVSLWAQARRYQIGGIPTTDAFRPRTLLKEADQ